MTQYNTGVLQTREIHFGDQNEITSITDVSWNGRRRLQKWIATPINATEGTFERWNRVDGAGVESATSVSDGGYDYTGVKLYDRAQRAPTPLTSPSGSATPTQGCMTALERRRPRHCVTSGSGVEYRI